LFQSAKMLQCKAHTDHSARTQYVYCTIHSAKYTWVTGWYLHFNTSRMSYTIIITW